MAAFSTVQYLLGRIPDVQTLLPSYDPELAVNAAKALYWDRFFPVDAPADLEDSNLTERRKVLCALRAACSTFLTMSKAHESRVTMAKAGPAETKFEEAFKNLKLVSEMWAAELAQLEAAEGIDFLELPTLPGYLKSIESFTETDATLDASAETIVQRGVIITH